MRPQHSSPISASNPLPTRCGAASAAFHRISVGVPARARIDCEALAVKDASAGEANPAAR
ncbi:hypothetical protein AUJ16_04205 [Candidatus Micrarchaeota archaeon CG1_02_60_51]|nr:MAG: hypothetical protein AUJ16_04205 [Candidatus Micrarchaeota archaeon CG1_02_60_51]